MAPSLAREAWAQVNATDYFECACPGRSYPLRVYDSENKTCEEACAGTSGRAPSGPDLDAIRAQQEREANERRQREQEEAAAAAARRARAAMDQQKFEADKKEAISLLKGVGTGETKLKGLGPPSGELRLGDGGDGARKCHVVDECSAALEQQAKALDAARMDQADLYTAMGAADFKHGWAQKAELFKTTPVDGPPFYVWHGKDQAGLPAYLRDYKATVDDIARLTARQRAAALNGAYDPKKTGLSGSSAMTPKQAADGLKAARDKARKLTDFSKYMRDLLRCSAGADADFDRCVKDATKLYEKLLNGLPLDKATKARIKAAGDAYTRYSTDALNRALDAGAAASQCFKGCR